MLEIWKINLAANMERKHCIQEICRRKPGQQLAKCWTCGRNVVKEASGYRICEIVYSRYVFQILQTYNIPQIS